MPFSIGYDVNYVHTDCVNDNHVVEVRFDKRALLNSIQQAPFAAHLTGETPKIILIDRDGRIGKYETRIRATAAMAGWNLKR